jgi:hypothetical protein
VSETDRKEDWWLCPKCKKRERENVDGDWLFYCGPCADRSYEEYRERADFEYWHRDEPTGGAE